MDIRSKFKSLGYNVFSDGKVENGSHEYVSTSGSSNDSHASEGVNHE